MRVSGVNYNGYRWLLFEKDMISDAVRQQIGWEPHFLEVARRFVASGDSVIDAGANFGYHTLELARMVGSTGKVFAFEPQRIIFQQLCTHIFTNGISNVWAYPWAVGQSYGQCAVPSIEQAIQGNLGATPIGRGAEISQIVPLDHIKDEQITFLKIDIQGAETACLQGARQLLEKHRPLIFIEIEENWLQRLGSSSKELVETLFAMNYSLFRIETEWPTDCICFPREKLVTVQERLKDFAWQTTLVSGNRVDFTFTDKPYWNSFTTTA